MADSSAAGAAEAGNAAGLKRAKSALTTMLDAPETRQCHDVFAAVPRKHGGKTESTPHTTLPVPRGTDYYFTVVLTIVFGIIIGYIVSVGIGLIFTLIDVLGGSCGQDTWMTDADVACQARIKNALAISIELRCHNPKPPAMLQEDFDGACGSSARIQTIITICIICGTIGDALYERLQHMPVNVVFHENLFTVEAKNGKEFACSYYADVTSAKCIFEGIEIKTKAKIKVNAGGADEEQDAATSCCEGNSRKKGKVLSVKGGGTIKLFAGDGDKKKEFLTAFAQHLPVSIEGLDGAPTPNTSYTASMLDGHLGDLVRARKAKADSEYDIARKPLTFDLFLDWLVVCLVILVGWYMISTFSTFIGWATNRGMDKCVDALRPGKDMCAVWRIFVPIQTPLTTPTDYINVIILCSMLVLVPLWYFTEMKVEYRFHKLGVMQELAYRGSEGQENVMIFPNDIKALKHVDGFAQKYIKATVQARYMTKGGIDKPFEITAKFEESDFKLMLVDTRFAACSGHGEKATAYNEKLFECTNKFKPGLLA